MAVTVECSSGAGAATYAVDGWRASAALGWRNAVTAAGTSTVRWRAYKAGRIGYAGAATLPAAKPSRLATRCSTRDAMVSLGKRGRRPGDY